ncbi:hypothetical protein SprV_0200702000 [Sparganum proliferum]
MATAPSPHTSARSVAYESIAQRLANQCLEQQLTLAVSASIVQTALAHSCTAWAYSATVKFMRAELTAAPTHLAHPAHPPCLAAPPVTSFITPRVSSIPTTQTPSPSADTTTSSTINITEADTDTAGLPMSTLSPYIPSHIGLVSHLRIHRPETCEPRLEHQSILAASASTVHIALAHLFIAWVY